MSRRRLHISDHAVLRYLERVRKIDLDDVRAEIACAVRIAEVAPDCGGVISDSVRYVIENDCVVTVTHASRPQIADAPGRRREGRRARGGARNLTRDVFDE